MSELVDAIYHGTLDDIRALLERGADPNGPADDGFPPLIAALSGANDPRTARADVEGIVRLLLAFGADPNLRGTNDYAALHMAVAERRPLAVHVLLQAGADPDLRTRIDDRETPLEMARQANLTDIAAILERRGRPMNQRLRSGLELLHDVPGAGEPVRRQHNYSVRVRMWLHKGDPVRWERAWGLETNAARLEDSGATLFTRVRVDRVSLVSGLFYGVTGMRVGGLRHLEIAPHLAYSDRGVPGVIPPGALLTAEITFLG